MQNTTSFNAPPMRRQKRKQSNLAYVRLSGRKVYLGTWGTVEAQTRYDAAVGEWLHNGREPLAKVGDTTLAELVEKYLDHLKGSRQDGNSIITAQSALGPLVRLYGHLQAKDFGPKRLVIVRGAIIEQGKVRKRPYTRNGVNRLVSEIRRMFRWAVREELVGVTVAQALDMVEGLRRGKCDLSDRPPVQPVDIKSLNAVSSHLNESTRALMWLMYYCGARCSEVAGLRRGDIDMSGELWVVVLNEHKTVAKTGQPRRLYLGKRAQAALHGLILKRKEGEALFDPTDYFRAKEARAFCHRRPDQQPNPRRTDRTNQETYDTTTFRHALGYACRNAGIPPFTPHQLRHAAATNIRRELGLEHAQAVLGHAEIEITQVYAAVSEKRAQEAMSKLG